METYTKGEKLYVKDGWTWERFEQYQKECEANGDMSAYAFQYNYEIAGYETVPANIQSHSERTEQVIVGYTCSCGATK